MGMEEGWVHLAWPGGWRADTRPVLFAVDAAAVDAPCIHGRGRALRHSRIRVRCFVGASSVYAPEPAPDRGAHDWSWLLGVLRRVPAPASTGGRGCLPAFVRASSDQHLSKFSYKGTPNNDLAVYSLVCEKVDGKWMMVHAQRSTGRDPEGK